MDKKRKKQFENCIINHIMHPLQYVDDNTEWICLGCPSINCNNKPACGVYYLKRIRGELEFVK